MYYTKKESVVKKILVLNLNVGSAIEYAGDIFISWARELGHEVVEYKEQTEAGHTLRYLIKEKPDLVVVNEYHHRTAVVTFLYTSITGVPVLYIDHVWSRVNNWIDDKDRSKYEELAKMWYRHLLDFSSFIFCLNSKPVEIPWHQRVRDKISNRYYPTDDATYNVTKPWSDRPNMFCYIGNILPHKLSSDFLAKICDTNLVVDCYGADLTRDDTYGRTFDTAAAEGNIQYKGLIPQDKIAEVMNEYKYFVLPHNGYEPFNWVLKQCAFCGTIPLVLNDRDTHLYNGKWIDWAAGLYMGCKFTDDFIANLVKINKEQPDHSKRSELISTTAKMTFPYIEFKIEFQSKVRELLNG